MSATRLAELLGDEYIYSLDYTETMEEYISNKDGDSFSTMTIEGLRALLMDKGLLREFIIHLNLSVGSEGLEKAVSNYNSEIDLSLWETERFAEILQTPDLLIQAMVSFLEEVKR